MKKVLLTHTGLNSFIIQPESYGATVDEGFIVGGPVGDFELLLCHGTVCVVGKMRDLILQLSKSSIYSTKPGVHVTGRIRGSLKSAKYMNGKPAAQIPGAQHRQF